MTPRLRTAMLTVTFVVSMVAMLVGLFHHPKAAEACTTDLGPSALCTTSLPSPYVANQTDCMNMQCTTDCALTPSVWHYNIPSACGSAPSGKTDCDNGEWYCYYITQCYNFHHCGIGSGKWYCEDDYMIASHAVTAPMATGLSCP